MEAGEIAEKLDRDDLRIGVEGGLGLITTTPTASRTDAGATPHRVLYIEDDLFNLELIERLFTLHKSLRLRIATRVRRVCR